ncbi:MAG: RNA-binding protein [Thermoprotei archaeon]|nr:MAG: RNA-binding protein [Thermoprotei archaeon]
MPYLLATTIRGVEKIAAHRIAEILENPRIVIKPHGFSGIILIEVEKDIDVAYELIKSEVPEVESLMRVLAEIEADPQKIAEKAAELSRENIMASETFAVRTIRRGRHNFTSIEINTLVGTRIQEVTSADVDLNYPDKVVRIDIIEDKAFISIMKGEEEWKKLRPGKSLMRPLLSKLAIIQTPYGGDPEGIYRVGVRIGRAVQTFEIKELVIAPYLPVDAEELKVFIEGLVEGRDSRYRIQVKTYSHKPHKVPISVQDLYQLIRERRDELIIGTSTRGAPLVSVIEDIAKDIRRSSRVNILIGSREGLPRGVLRYSDYMIDVIPTVTLPTDHASTAIIMALLTALDSIGFFEKFTYRARSKGMRE